MGMTWSEYKAYREKKKKEEEQTKKQQKTSSNKVEKTITNNANNQEKNNNLINTISQNNRLPLNNENANKIASNTPSLQDIVSKNNSSKIVQSNNNPLAQQIEEQNANKPLQKAIEEQKKKPKTTQKEPSTWERIMDNFRIGGYGGITGVAQTGYRDIRDIDNMYTDASSSLRHQVLSTFFGEHGENFARAVDDKLYKWNNDRNQVYNYALDILNKEQQTNKQNIQQNIEAVKQSGDKVGTKFAELAPSVGNNAMGLLAGTVNPALAFTYYKGSSEASYYDDALQRGMTEDQAKVYSKLMSYVEAGTETISAGNILKGGKAIKAVASGAKNIGVKEGLKAGFNVFKESAKEETANALKQGLKSYGIGIIEEFFQEAITEPIQEFTAMKVAGEDKADWNNMWQRMLQSGVDGALSSAILAGANMGISSCQGIVTKVQNGQEFTAEEYNTAIKDASKKVDVGKMTTDGIKNQVEKLKTEMQQSQNGVNKDINQENKMPQNQFSQAEKTETLRQEARNKLESIKQNYDENSYNQMQEFIETAPNEKALNQVISDLNKEAETKQVAPLKQKQEVQLPLKQETQNKSFEDVVFDAMNNYESNEVESPLKNRDMDSIGKQTKVNAYQYDNPKVKPYFQEMAQQMGEDLAYISSSDNRSTQKGGGTKLSTTTKAMDILHNEQGYSYDQIAKGLQNIIDDKGSENNAISKKIELVIDEQLRNGYTNALGKNIEPNQEYINTIQGNKEVQLPMKQKQEVSLPLNENVVNNQENSQEQNQTISKDTNKVMDEVQNYIKNNDLDMTTDEFVEWASNVELENEENMTQEQKELYSLISDIQNRTSGMYNENNVDFDKNTYLDYNNKEKNITDSMLSAYSVDNRVEEYFKYNHIDKFYNLTYEEMEKASSVVSDRISENNNGVANDDKYIYYYNAENNDAKNYTITDILEIKEGREEIANERNIDRNSRRSISKGIRQNSSIGDNQSTRYSTTSEKNTSMDSKQSSSESEGNNKKSIRNKQNIENSKESSFSIVDNQGRQLSKQQQEFFKDSKVRNDKGELLEVYHGTKTDGINIFKYNPNKQTGTDYGKAFYFTSDYTKAQGYQYDIENDALYKEYDRKDKEYKNWVFEEGISEDERSNRIKEWSKWHENNNVFDILNNEEFTPERMPKGETKKVYLNLTNPYIANANGEYYSKVYDKYFKEARENGNDGIIVKNVIDVARGEHRPIDVYIAFNENQIKNIDNKAPTDNLDIRYELEDHSDNTAENEIQRKINRSMTMKEAEDMIQRAFVTGNIYDWYDGKYKNGNEWLQGEGAEDVSMWIENDYNLQNKYINSNEDILNEEYTIDDVIEAYQNNALTGNEEKQTQRLDTSKDTGYKDNRFFAPKEVTGGKELYDLASQRVTNKNRSEVYKARADFIINAHNEGYIDNLGLSQKEVNEALRKWTNYPLKARNISGYINQGVATENKWVGIENSSIVNEISVSSEQLDSLVKEVKGTSNEYQRRYIVNTMLALDTHLDYKGLTYDFAPNVEKMGESALADYSPETDTIRVRREGLNTIAHETGHYIDQLLGREIGDGYNLGITTLCRTNFSKELTTQQKQFLNNFSNFLTSIEDVSDIGSTYKMSSNEVFARFVARFVEWTRNTATGNRYGYEADWYKDNFTQPQYVEFAKLLQEYSLLKTTNQVSDKIIRGNKNVYDQRIEDIYAELNKKKKQEVKAPMKGNVQQSQENTKVKFDNEVMKTNSEIKGNSETSEKVAKILSEPTKNVKPEQRTWAILKANFIDKGAVFEKISQKTNNRDLQGKYDYTLTAGARGQYAIGNDRYVYTNGKKTLQSKSLTSIMDEVGENTQAFNEYMYHQLNVDRMTLDERFGIENKPVFGESITADISRAEIAKIEEQHPEFKEYANDVYKYLEANKQELVDRGVISQETSDFFKERYPHYVPIQRATRKGNSIDVALDTKRTGINSPIKKAKGGNQDINPLFQTMASQTLQTYRASARNNFGLELKNTLQQMNQLNENRAIADIDDIVDTMTNEEQNNELLQPGKKGENPTFTVFEDGKKITYDISQDMYDALKPKSEILNKLDNTKLAKAGRKISNFRRGVLTEYNPIFSITNAIKDAQDVLINSQHSAKTYAKFPEAYAQIVKKGYWYNEYIQNGGEQNSYFTEGDFENIKKTKLDKAKNVLKIPFEKISQVNNVIEMAPRLAEYIVSRQNGANIETAMLDASRVTTNFKAGGDITKFANRNGATFLNASVQGFQQQVRNIQEANMKGLKGWTNLALKYTVAGLPALLLNNLFWDDDDDYEQLQDYVKDNYYVVAKLPNGNFLRIPKGRMVATIQKVVSNANDFVKDGKINSDDVASTIWNDLKEDVSFGMDNLAPNNPIDNNILSPIIQVAQNKTWYGDDLVPQRLQDVPEEEQADETTDKFSKWLGEKLKVSPIKINYLLDQYSGGIGDVLLPLGTPQAENNVIEDKFTTDPVMKSQYPADFFNKRDELNVRNNSLKATDEDKLKYKYISSIQSNISDLYKQKREIQASDKTDKEKKAELKKVQKQINELARESLETVDKVEINGNGAKIGEQEYYKKNGTWTKLTEKEKEKLRNTSMSTYSSYQSQISGKDLKDFEKIQILRDSNYSSEEKSNLYEKTISTDKYYSTLKKSGIDIDEYMDYKLAQSNGKFTADKKNGKTVMGSGKKKVLNYLNKNITGYGNRLLIAGKQYSLTDSQRKDLSDYINKTFATQAERTKVYEQLKLNFVVNGNRVTYK